MGILDRILANKMLSVANKVAPVISSSILLGFLASGKKMGVVLGDEITSGQKSAIESRMDALERKVWWEFGSGA